VPVWFGLLPILTMRAAAGQVEPAPLCNIQVKPARSATFRLLTPCVRACELHRALAQSPNGVLFGDALKTGRMISLWMSCDGADLCVFDTTCRSLMLIGCARLHFGVMHVRPAAITR
jgi:hypothetical protein